MVENFTYIFGEQFQLLPWKNITWRRHTCVNENEIRVGQNRIARRAYHNTAFRPP